MQFNEKDILLIEDYLDGKLATEAVKEFEKRLKTDKDFAKAFDLRKSMPALLRDAHEFESTRDEVRSAMQKQKQVQVGLNRNWMYIAATIVILIGLFLLIRYNNRNDEPGTQMADEIKEERLKTDEPDNYAKLNKVSNEVELILPVEMPEYKAGEKIILRWKTESHGRAMLFVKQAGDSGVSFRSEVSLSEKEYILENKTLSVGNYNWYINDSIEKGSFRIISGK